MSFQFENRSDEEWIHELRKFVKSMWPKKLPRNHRVSADASELTGWLISKMPNIGDFERARAIYEDVRRSEEVLIMPAWDQVDPVAEGFLEVVDGKVEALSPARELKAKFEKLYNRRRAASENKGHLRKSPASLNFPDLIFPRHGPEDDLELELLNRVTETYRGLEREIFDLVLYYHSAGRHALETQYLTILQTLTQDPDRRAHFLLTLGQASEGMAKFEEAISHYRSGILLEPASADIWYLLHNNLGYSLVQVKRFEEAEPFCRKAIEIQPWRHNAHKNLGLSLEGQKRYIEAAESYAEAYRRYSGDPRSLSLLKALAEAQPEVLESEIVRRALGVRI